MISDFRAQPAFPMPTPGWLDKTIIRLADKEDLPKMEWEGEFSHFRRVYADGFHRMMQGYSLVWVAELSGVGLLGQVFIQLTCDRPELANGLDRAYLYSFRIRPAYRSGGLGTNILQVTYDDLRSRDFHYLTLNVAKDNYRAQLLYKKQGFRIIAHEPGIWSYQDQFGEWHHVEEPAWRMEKNLDV
jgi:ribosomal protein S18 acetylase RimI-like enzyme